MRVPDIASIFKYAIDFKFGVQEDKVVLSKPGVRLALLEFFYMIKPVYIT